MRGDGFIYAGAPGSFLDRFLYDRFVNVMAAGNPRAFVFGYFRGGEEVLPYPVFIRVFVFVFEGIRKVDRAESVGKVFFVKGLYVS